MVRVVGEGIGMMGVGKEKVREWGKRRERGMGEGPKEGKG